MPTKKWTEEEEDFLRDNYMEMTNAELADKYDITKNAVQKKLARMGLKRSQARKKPKVEEKPKAEATDKKKAEVVSKKSHFFTANNLYHEERDYEKAIEEYNQAIEEESNLDMKLKARYWMAEAHVKLGNIEDAVDIFGKLADEYGSNYLGDSARRRSEALKEYISTQS